MSGIQLPSVRISASIFFNPSNESLARRASWQSPNKAAARNSPTKSSPSPGWRTCSQRHSSNAKKESQPNRQRHRCRSAFKKRNSAQRKRSGGNNPTNYQSLFSLPAKVSLSANAWPSSPRVLGLHQSGDSCVPLLRVA